MSSLRFALKTRGGAQWAAAALAFVCLLLFLIPVVATFRAQAHKVAYAEAELGHLRAEASVEPALRQQLRDISGRISNLPGLLRGRSLAAAQTELQQSVESLASSSKASIRSTQMLPAIRAGAFDVVQIQYDLTAPMSRLADLTYAIESQEPYMFLRNVQIAGGDNWQSGQVGKGQDIQLNLRWIVRGYRWRRDR
jgi:general secretion pathway protein M